MKVLVACEESQVVCKALREKGHELREDLCRKPSSLKNSWTSCSFAGDTAISVRTPIQ